MTDRPMAAVILLVIGSIFYTFGGVAVGMLVRAPRFVPGPGIGGAIEPNWAATSAIVTGVVCSVAIVASALLAHTGVKRRIRLGSFMSILFSIVGFGNTFGGLWIGLVLVLAGNLLALRWKPKSLSPTASATPARQA